MSQLHTSSPAEVCNPVCETKLFLVHTGLNCLINVRYRAIFGWILDKMWTSDSSQACARISCFSQERFCSRNEFLANITLLIAFPQWLTKSDLNRTPFGIYHLATILYARSPRWYGDSWLMLSCHFRRLGAGGISKSRYFSITWQLDGSGSLLEYQKYFAKFRTLNPDCRGRRSSCKQWKWTSSAGLSFIIQYAILITMPKVAQ